MQASASSAFGSSSIANRASSWIYTAAGTGGRAQLVEGVGLVACDSELALELVELAFETARENGKAVPRLRIEALVVDVEARRVTFALPLVSREQTKEAREPREELAFAVAPELRADEREDLAR